MNSASRREFLQTTAVLLATAVAGSSFDFKKKNQLLSFSTLGCPDWTFRQTINFAVQHGYHGIEIRGIQRELDLTKCKEFNSPQARQDSLRMMKDKNLKFTDLGSSTTLHFPEGSERKKHLDDGKRFIDLAQDIQCPFVRVFPNNFPKDQEKNVTIELIAKGLLELGDYAKGSRVSVLMETHGDFVETDDLVKVMQLAEHRHTGLVWDITNMWTITKESPTQVYRSLKKYIRHTHIKDAKLVDGKPQYVLMGRGEVPIFKAVDLLVKDGYKGYYSFEWEKLWHPELEDPETALADYPVMMKKHFESL